MSVPRHISGPSPALRLRTLLFALPLLATVAAGPMAGTDAPEFGGLLQNALHERWPEILRVWQLYDHGDATQGVGAPRLLFGTSESFILLLIRP